MPAEKKKLLGKSINAPGLFQPLPADRLAKDFIYSAIDREDTASMELSFYFERFFYEIRGYCFKNLRF
jgi:hypothetical protein